MLTMTPDIHFFLKQYETRVFFWLPRAVLAWVLKMIFFSASKLVLDCGRCSGNLDVIERNAHSKCFGLTMSLVLILEKQNNNDRLCLPRGSLSEVGWALCYISIGLVGVCLEPLTSSRLLASRCILGFQATGLRPRRWFLRGSQSEVWWVLCYISIALVVDCLDVIKWWRQSEFSVSRQLVCDLARDSHEDR